MAKSEKERYAPGELSRVRERLGPVGWQEAKELAQKLGGEVGYERSAEEIAKSQQDSRSPGRPGRPTRRIELLPEDGGEEGSKKKSQRHKGNNPLDDPAISLKPSFFDRLKMDRYAAQPEFEIKSPGHIIQLMVSFFSHTPDNVSSVFVNRRMPEYYKKIETLVVSTRTMFPRNNARRNEQLKKASPLAYAVLDIIRYWNIEKISGDLGRFQARPKSSSVSDFAEILKAVYKPLFILEHMDPEVHIRGAYKLLYKLLFLENPEEAKKKGQILIRTALSAFFEIRRDIRFLLYPLLMKSVSSKYVHYNNFFSERKHRIMAFLNVTEEEQLDSAVLPMQGQTKNPKDGEDESKEEEKAQEEKELSEEEKAQISYMEAEKKALDQAYQTLEALFPQAGWDRLDSYPDLYPYFEEIFDLRRGVVNIAPTDPVLQVLILMRILEELFYGTRQISFGNIPGTGGTESGEEVLSGIINGWRHYIETSFGNEYLPRMSEYIRILDGSIEDRTSPYTKKLVSELHWLKRLYYLPYYKFESLGAPPFQRKDVEPVYSKIKSLRKHLAFVASGIEQGNKAGGAEARISCDGINNPWEPYVFQVPNPLSIRLNALIPQKARNNAALIYFCLAVTTVLDYLVNNENSWAYDPPSTVLFRSVDGEGITPLTGVDTKIDAEAIFKEALKKRQKN